jgi:ABC-type uncharacterized transport system substrate-binding protein
VIAATGSIASASAAKAATATIPVVFTVAEDPVGIGLVASLARPGGNLTGVNFLNTELAAKRLDLLRELVPAAKRVAVLVNPASVVNSETNLREVEAAARAMGLQIQVFRASTSGEINVVFGALARPRPDALFVGGDGFFVKPTFPTGQSSVAPLDPRIICRPSISRSRRADKLREQQC